MNCEQTAWETIQDFKIFFDGDYLTDSIRSTAKDWEREANLLPEGQERLEVERGCLVFANYLNREGEYNVYMHEQEL